MEEAPKLKFSIIWKWLYLCLPCSKREFDFSMLVIVIVAALAVVLMLTQLQKHQYFNWLFCYRLSSASTTAWTLIFQLGTFTEWTNLFLLTLCQEILFWSLVLNSFALAFCRWKQESETFQGDPADDCISVLSLIFQCFPTNQSIPTLPFPPFPPLPFQAEVEACKIMVIQAVTVQMSKLLSVVSPGLLESLGLNGKRRPWWNYSAGWREAVPVWWWILHFWNCLVINSSKTVKLVTKWQAG